MSKPRILVIEDEPSVSSYFRHALWGDFEVEIAETISDAMARLADESIPIQCLTLDLNMPDGIGPTLIKKFRESFPAIPIVVISGFDFSVIESVAAGAAEFLRKTETSPTLLIETLKRAINSRRQSG